MEIIETPIPGLLEIHPRVFRDDRGYFVETFNAEKYAEIGIDPTFVQDNQSLSQKGVLRGLHFQQPPHAQGKLVRVISGRVLDVAVDIRVGSPTFGQHHSVVLDAEKMNQFWIPAGFAHGFLTLEDHTTFAYKCTDVYHPETEGSIRFNDPQLGIEWGIDEPLLSEKDRNAPLLAEFDSPFKY